MKRKTFLFVLVTLIILFVSVAPVLAQDDEPPACDVPPCVYVDTSRAEGNEDGSTGYPYNKVQEGKALAQSLTNGAYLWVKDANGKWEKTFVPRAVPGAGGELLPEFTRYILWVVLAVLLLATGWYLLSRSRQAENQ